MSNWLAEHMVGISPPFLQRNIVKAPPRPCRKILEKECCSIEVTDLGGDFEVYEIRGHLETPYGIVPATPRIKDPIVLYSCFDRLVLYIFAFRDRQVRLFSLQLYGCQQWRNGEFQAQELNLFGRRQFLEAGSESLQIKCKITNLRDEADYHYNIFSHTEPVPELFKIEFMGRICSVEKFFCILCFCRFGTMCALRTHVRLCHHRFEATTKNGMLSIVQTAPKEGPEFLSVPQDAAAGTPNGCAFPKKGKHGTTSGCSPNAGFAGVCRLLAYRRHGTKPIIYLLKTHRTLMEHEYNTLDYLGMLSDHASSRMQSARGENQTDLAIMKAWNKLRICNMSAKNALKIITVKFNFSREIIRLMELLYTKAILTSRDLIEIIDTYQLIQSFGLVMLNMPEKRGSVGTDEE